MPPSSLLGSRRSRDVGHPCKADIEGPRAVLGPSFTVLTAVGAEKEGEQNGLGEDDE